MSWGSRLCVDEYRQDAIDLLKQEVYIERALPKARGAARAKLLRERKYVSFKSMLIGIVRRDGDRQPNARHVKRAFKKLVELDDKAFETRTHEYTWLRGLHLPKSRNGTGGRYRRSR